MMIEERFAQTDFSNLSQVKDSLLMRLKLRRRAINEEHMSLAELDQVAAAGNPLVIKIFSADEKNPRQ